MSIDNILSFLADLSKNNNKDWFDVNRSRYEVVKKEFTYVASFFISGICSFDSSLENLQAKDTIFRINRDIRFSNDKTPYKTYLGSYMIKGGRKNWGAGYYLHLEPNNVFIAVGLHCPNKDWLTKVREEIAENGDVLHKIMNTKKFKDIWGDFGGEESYSGKLKKAPKDFDPNHKYIELIKMKGYDLAHYYSKNDYKDWNMWSKSVLSNFKLAKPVNDFFNSVL